MKLVAAALGVMVGASLAGCAGAPKAPTAKSTFELAENELAHTIGAPTTLTSAGVEAARTRPTPNVESPPPASTVVQTWSTPGSDDPDLAKNPYDPE